MKKILLASDSFKGSLSSQRIIELCQEEIKLSKANVELISVPIADGGEGSLEAFQSALGGNKVSIKVHDANGNLIKAEYLLSNQSAYIEVASCISLPKTHLQNPLYTSSFGVGELILDAIKKGIKSIYIALGGSSTNDGGAPMLSALGAIFLDQEGNKITDLSNHNLKKICSIDLSPLKELTKGVSFYGLCDVRNPLLGENGASFTYAKQKGAKEDELPLLEANLSHYARKLSKTCKKDFKPLPGAGAAGGIGFGLATAFDAQLVSGIDALLDAVQFDDKIQKADYIISGEGKLDFQSFNGKVIDGVLKHCQKFGKNLSLIVGSISPELKLPKEIDYLGITSLNRKSWADIQANAEIDYQKAFSIFLKQNNLV